MYKAIVILTLYALFMTIIAYIVRLLIPRILDLFFDMLELFSKMITHYMVGRYWILIIELLLFTVFLVWVLAPLYFPENSFLQPHTPEHYLIFVPCYFLIASIGNQLNTKNSGGQPSIMQYALRYVLQYRMKYPISRTIMAIKQFSSLVWVFVFNISVISILPVLPDAPPIVQYLLISAIPLSAALWIYGKVNDGVVTNLRRVMAYIMLVIWGVGSSYSDFVQWVTNPGQTPKISTDQWLHIIIFGLFTSFDRLFKVISDDMRGYQK